MQLLLSNKNKKYFDSAIIENIGSHYTSTKDLSISEIIINLRQVYRHSKEYRTSIEHTFIQHVAHETIHKILRENIGDEESTMFDNIAGLKAKRKYGNLQINKWFSGFLEV